MKDKCFGSAVPLLCVVLVLGCDNNTPVPLAPESPSTPLLMSMTTGSDTYEYTHSGDVTTDPPTRFAIRGVGKKSQQIRMSGCCNRDKFVFSDAFKNTFDDELGPGAGQLCFQGPMEFSGALNPDKKDPSVVRGGYFFSAFGTDGVTEFKYQLLLTGTVPSGTFPPEPDENVTVTWSGANSAEMNTEGKGKGSKGKNADSACTGTVDINGSVLINGIT